MGIVEASLPIRLSFVNGTECIERKPQINWRMDNIHDVIHNYRDQLLAGVKQICTYAEIHLQRQENNKLDGFLFNLSRMGDECARSAKIGRIRTLPKNRCQSFKPKCDLIMLFNIGVNNCIFLGLWPRMSLRCIRFKQRQVCSRDKTGLNIQPRLWDTNFCLRKSAQQEAMQWLETISDLMSEKRSHGCRDI